MPIGLVTWHLGRRAGLAIVLLAAGAGVLGDLLNDTDKGLIPYWKRALRLGVLLVSAALLAALKSSIELQRQVAIHEHDVSEQLRDLNELKNTLLHVVHIPEGPGRRRPGSGLDASTERAAAAHRPAARQPVRGDRDERPQDEPAAERSPRPRPGTPSRLAADRPPAHGRGGRRHPRDARVRGAVGPSRPRRGRSGPGGARCHDGRARDREPAGERREGIHRSAPPSVWPSTAGATASSSRSRTRAPGSPTSSRVRRDRAASARPRPPQRRRRDRAVAREAIRRAPRRPARKRRTAPAAAPGSRSRCPVASPGATKYPPVEQASLRAV